MRRSTVGIVLILALGCLVVPRAAEAQQPAKGYRIGVLGLNSAANTVAGIEALRQGLHELGYAEGQNLTLEMRWAEGRPEHLADLVAELVRLPVDLLVTSGTLVVQAAQHATTTLPIVVATMGDPVENGIVASVAHPGGNLTGSFFSERELEAKGLELLKEAVPGVTRVAVLRWAASLANQAILEALERTARDLRVALQPVEVHGPDDFERAFRAIAHGHAEALMVSSGVLFSMHSERIWDFMVAQRLPTIGPLRQCLMAYTFNSLPQWRRAAVFINKILHGARPGDLPMERATDYELRIDLKIAQELGLTISESLLMRADRVYPVSGVLLPASVRIVPPDRRVAPELAAFSGKWVGTREGPVTGEVILIVEAIDPPHARVIWAVGNGIVRAGAAPVWRGVARSTWFRLRGQFVEGTLQVSIPGGTTSRYHLQPDGTLALTATLYGEMVHATMTRAPE